MTAEAVNSHAGDDLPPKRSRGGVTSGASLGCEAVNSHAGDDLPPKRSRGGVTQRSRPSAAKPSILITTKKEAVH